MMILRHPNLRPILDPVKVALLESVSVPCLFVRIAGFYYMYTWRQSAAHRAPKFIPDFGVIYLLYLSYLLNTAVWLGVDSGS